jgi:hypothetical protein
MHLPQFQIYRHYCQMQKLNLCRKIQNSNYLRFQIPQFHFSNTLVFERLHLHKKQLQLHIHYHLIHKLNKHHHDHRHLYYYW